MFLRRKMKTKRLQMDLGRRSSRPKSNTEKCLKVHHSDYSHRHRARDRNSKEDQTAFSLLFKKNGFTTFSEWQRDEVFVLARNTAKVLFVAAAKARGEAFDQDSYINAADRDVDEWYGDSPGT